MADTTTTTTETGGTTTADTGTTQTTTTETSTAQTAASNTLFTEQPPAQTQQAVEGVPEWLPEKFRVIEDGKFNADASSKKLAESYANLEKMKGQQAPAKPEDYTFTPPEQFKDVGMDPDLSRSFRERAHAKGLSQEQYEFVMGEYFAMVPSVLDGAAKFTADEARAELSKVWSSPTELQANMTHAERAVAQAPEALRAQVREKYATDPVFFQFAALFGKEAREDRPPQQNGSGPVVTDVEALMRSDAYRNPKHADHAKVSQQVREAFEKRFGNKAAFQ